MKVIVTGATGMVGRGVLLECLENPDVAKVLSLGRSPLGMAHPKLEEVVRSAFMFRPGYIHPRKGVRSRTALYPPSSRS